MLCFQLLLQAAKYPWLGRQVTYLNGWEKQVWERPQISPTAARQHYRNRLPIRGKWEVRNWCLIDSFLQSRTVTRLRRPSAYLGSSQIHVKRTGKSKGPVADSLVSCVSVHGAAGRWDKPLAVLELGENWLKRPRWKMGRNQEWELPTGRTTVNVKTGTES